jgi:hypothetical protein
MPDGSGIRKRRLSVGVRLSEKAPAASRGSRHSQGPGGAPVEEGDLGASAPEKPLRLDSLPIGEAVRRQIGHSG